MKANSRYFRPISPISNPPARQSRRSRRQPTGCAIRKPPRANSTRCRNGPAHAGTTCATSTTRTRSASWAGMRSVTGRRASRKYPNVVMEMVSSACSPCSISPQLSWAAWTFTSAAPSTPCCICFTRGSGTRFSLTSAMSRRRSLSRSSSTKGSFSARTDRRCRSRAAMS